MKALVPITGQEEEEQIIEMLRSLPKSIEELIVLHVQDPSPEKTFEMLELGHHHISKYRLEEVQKTQEAYAQQAVNRAIDIIRRYVDILATGIILKGRANEEIMRAIQKEGAELVILFAKKNATGPKSIGKTARFVLDHAPCSVLLIRK